MSTMEVQLGFQAAGRAGAKVLGPESLTQVRGRKTSAWPERAKGEEGQGWRYRPSWPGKGLTATLSAVQIYRTGLKHEPWYD